MGPTPRYVPLQCGPHRPDPVKAGGFFANGTDAAHKACFELKTSTDEWARHKLVATELFTHGHLASTDHQRSGLGQHVRLGGLGLHHGVRHHQPH